MKDELNSHLTAAEIKKPKAMLEELIRANGSAPYKHGSIDDCLGQLADLIIFGAMKLCPKCKTGPLRYR